MIKKVVYDEEGREDSEERDAKEGRSVVVGRGVRWRPATPALYKTQISITEPAPLFQAALQFQPGDSRQVTGTDSTSPSTSCSLDSGSFSIIPSQVYPACNSFIAFIAVSHHQPIPTLPLAVPHPYAHRLDPPESPRRPGSRERYRAYSSNTQPLLVCLTFPFTRRRRSPVASRRLVSAPIRSNAIHAHARGQLKKSHPSIVSVLIESTHSGVQPSRPRVILNLDRLMRLPSTIAWSA